MSNYEVGNLAFCSTVFPSCLLPSPRKPPCWNSESVSHSVISDSLWPHGLWPTRLLCPWDSPGKNTGAGCHFLLQGIFPTHGPNLGLLHCRQNLYCLSHWGSPCSNRVVINWHVPCSKSTYFFLPSLHPMDSYPFICLVIMDSLNYLSECTLCKLAKWTYISGGPTIHKSSLGSACLHP